MTQDEYERRRRRLDEELDAGIELLRAAHGAQARALDLVWMTSPDGPAASPLPLGQSPAAPAPPATAATPVQPARRPAGQLAEEVEAALAQCPQTFEVGDLLPLLGYEPNRGSLYRVLREMVVDGVIAVAVPGEGQRATQYRKL